MRNKQNTRGFTIVEVVLGILVLALVGYIAWTAIKASGEKKDNKTSTTNTQTTTKKQTTDAVLDWKRIDSAQKGFSVQLPDGWGEFIRPADSDQLVLMGQNQPTYVKGKDVAVKDLEGFGTDAPTLMTIMIYDNVVEPKGAATDFNIGELNGKKYSYVAPVDTERGLGQEDAGDKLYDYRFDLNGGKQLVVWYHVYANTDNHDQIATVDKIVKSIKLAR